MNPKEIFDLIVVGGGAAGFFGAINTAQQNPKSKILILEKSPKLLSKVKISGGGRCNVTHNELEATPLSKHYPRGQKELKKIFRAFNAKDTIDWFAARGIKLKTEDDGRIFPVTDDSQTITNCFLQEADKYKIQIEINCGVEKIEKKEKYFLIYAEKKDYCAKKILVAVGGHPQKLNYEWIENTGHTISTLLPSLFTFNDSEKKFKDLMGVAVADAEIKIASTKFSERGPLLITHWGLSGPAVIKLSSWSAAYLFEKNYLFTALVNWTGSLGEDKLRSFLLEHKTVRGKQKIATNAMFNLPLRLWERLVELAEISDVKIWAEISTKEMNRLIELLIRCPFQIKGKTTFKEEFVTCGGVELSEIDLETMQSKIMPGLYFAGEVLNIDGETGGFNFQSAWSTAFVAAQSISK